MRKFTKSDVKTILFEADAYLRNAEKVKTFNYADETLAEGQEIYDDKMGTVKLFLKTFINNLFERNCQMLTPLHYDHISEYSHR